MIWLDRVGMVLQFLAFWLIAPEVLGHAGVHRLRSGLKRLIELALVVPFGLGIVLLTWALLFREFAEHLASWHRLLGLGIVTLAVFLASYWLFRRQRLMKLLDEIEADEQIRSRLLRIGAAAFSVGFLLQLTASFR